MTNRPSRRDMFQIAGLASLGVAAQAAPAASMAGVPFERKMTIRLGFVGLGGRGTGQLQNFLGVDNIEVMALCDIVKEKAERAQQLVQKAGQSKTPAVYAGHERAYEALVARDDIDMVINCTSWDWHVPVAVDAMKHGKHAAVEVPAATTIEDCWKMVDTSEQTRRHCIQLENCCYGYNEMLVLNLVRDGVLGELTHGAAAYLHDLRSLLFANQGEGLWRRFPHMKHNGNLYPTHGLGPVARYMDIHHGDRFETLVSMSSAPRALAAWRDSHLPADDPRRKEVYLCGDQSTSLIRTAKGRVITLEHNTTSPEPYDRINLIAGTQGIFRDYPPRIYVDGKGKDAWGPLDPYKAKYEDPYWTRMGEIARRRGGHGGMDFIQVYRLMECMQKGLAPDMDVYDAAAWSAPGPLSEMSVAKGSAPMPFPDFTRGSWKKPRA
jgi:predicted dehydrogenase